MKTENGYYNTGSESKVTVNKARRILGPLVSDYSDTQVREIIHTLQLLAKEQLSYTGSKEYKSSNDI